LFDQSEELDRMIDDKNAIIESLSKEIAVAKQNKAINAEEQKRKLLADIEARRVLYKPIMSDQIDFLMAQALNGCEYFVPTTRIVEGSYMFGTQRITAKLMDEKLVVKAGGGYMLID
jgi:hypothetical protein